MDRNKIAYLRAFIHLCLMQVTHEPQNTLSGENVSSSLCPGRHFLSYGLCKEVYYLVLKENTSAEV